MLGSANADPSIFNFDDRSILDEQYTTGDQYISSLYTTGINYDTNTIDGLLITSGYEPLNSGYQDIIKKRTVIDLTNPFGIEVDGCGTVTANLDEALAVLLHAIKNAMGVLPDLAKSRMFGLPNFENPKEVFNWVYDMTTTAMCMGTSGITTSVETGVRAAPTMLKNLLSTWTGEEKDTSKNTQIGTLCSYIRTKDEWEENKENSTSKTAEEKTGNKLGSTATTSFNAKFHKCKTKFEEYKSYINSQMSLLDVYKERALDIEKTSCDLLNEEKKQEEGNTLIPNNKTWILSNPFYMSVAQPEIISTSMGYVGGNLKINENNNSQKKEVIVDKKAVMDIVLNVQGEIPYYTSKEKAVESGWDYTKHNAISDYIYDIGISYANIITGCFNNDPYYDDVCKSDDVKSYFPIDMYSSHIAPSFLEIVSKKRMLCDLTEFNEGDKDFLLSSIGLIIMKDYENKKNPDEPSIKDFEAAINTIILNDYCTSKLDMDIDLLEEETLQLLMSKINKINQKERGLLSAAKIWKDQEMVLAIPAMYNDGKVIKICNAHKKQKTFYIATEVRPKKDDKEEAKKKKQGSANIIKIDSKFTDNGIIDIRSLEKELKIKIEGKWSSCELGDRKCDFIENSFFAPLDVEMLCDGSAGHSTCNAKKLSCGINFSEKDASKRTDELYVDGDSDTNPKGKYAIYKLKREEDKEDASEDDFSEKINEGIKEDVDKVIYFTSNTLSPAAKELLILMKYELKKILITLRK